MPNEPGVASDMVDAAHRTFHHLAAQKSRAYRAILRLFVMAKERFELAVRPSEILARLNVEERQEASLHDEDAVIACLSSLCDWGNLGATRDVVSARTLEEYLRPKLLYQLTHAGDMTERALAMFDEGLLRPGELSVTALRDIAETLEYLVYMMGVGGFDEAKAVRAMNDLFQRFDTLTARAQTFLLELPKELDKPAVDESSFLSLKEKLLEYLDNFVKELVNATFRICRSLNSLKDDEMASVLEAVARAELMDELSPSEARHAQTAQRCRMRWAGLRGWFIGDHNHPAHVESLRSRALDAIPALLDRLQRMHALRANRMDRSTDFLALARWFAEAPSEDDLHRLWRTAFALNSARHLRVNTTTLQAWAGLENEHRLSWEECPPYIITITQWTRGRMAPRGKPPAIIDRKAARAALREQANAEQRALREARRTLADMTPCRLSELRELSTPAFEVLLDAIGEALALIDPDGLATQAITADGGMTVSIALDRPLRDSGGPEAVIRCSDGTLWGPDLSVTLRLSEAEEVMS